MIFGIFWPVIRANIGKKNDGHHTYKHFRRARNVVKFSHARDCNAPIDLSLMSSNIGNSVLPDAIIMVTSRPTIQLPMISFQCTVELYGFSRDSINKRVSIFSANNRELEHFIRKNFEENQNLITYCYIPLQCQFVCQALADVHSQGMDGDVPVIKMTPFYVN